MIMKVLFFSSENSHHDCKWINQIAIENEVEVIASNVNRVNQLNSGIRLHKILPPYSYKTRNRKETLDQIREIITNFQPDVIHSMYLFPNSIWANQSGFKPHVITTRGSDILVEYPNNYHNVTSKFKPLINRHFNKEGKLALENAQFVTCTSNLQKERIKHLTSSEVQIIRTGVDVAKIDLTLQKSESRRNESYTIFSPREPRLIYNLDIIVKAFHIFLSYCENAKLVMLSNDSDYSRKVKQICEGLGLKKNVEFIQELGFKDLMQQYASANQVVMIPKSDGTPNTALEAMLCKVPVILGTATYDNDLFNQKTVSQLSNSDHHTLALEMKRIYEMDKAKLSEQIENASNVVRNHANLCDSIEQIIKIYSAISK